LKSVRLLPVVIFAALALLLFKGIGLVTNGGYVLTGSNAVLAAGASGGHGEAAAPAAGAADATPSEVVLNDLSPTLDDSSPTMATRETAAAGGHGGGAESSAAHGEESSSSDAHGEEESSSEEEDVACPPVVAAQEDPHAETPATGCEPSEIPVNEHGDALPLIQDGDGNFVPLDVIEGDNSEEALLARLAERRAELDKRDADIAMRTALLEAAEKRLDERTKELAALEAQVAALVDEKQAAEEAGFKAVVTMYESMKPKDAAKIFDTLNTTVLVKVVRAMSPRKMSPILAAMSPEPAQKLTIALAATENTDVVPASAGENLAALPQIVGQ
jgi:flagellar motility protein MotE (MotC chaperone)